MYSTHILKHLFLIIGLIITFIGSYMKFANLSTSGSYSNKYGTISQPNTINGNTTLLIGIALLICALISHFIYKTEKKKRQKIRIEEEKEKIFKKAKPINFYKNPTKYFRK